MNKIGCLLFVFIFLTILSKSLFAQDTIFSLNGDKQLVEMMYISGDTVVFRKEGGISKISSNGILKIKFENGNVTDFAPIAIKKVIPKPNLIFNYPDEPITILNGNYFIGPTQLRKRDVDRMIDNQSNPELQIGFKSLKKLENGKTFFLSALLLSTCIAASYLRFQNKSAASASQQKTSNYNFAIGGGLIAIGLFTFPFHLKSIEKRKELVNQYNSIYYPK